MRLRQELEQELLRRVLLRRALLRRVH